MSDWLDRNTLWICAALSVFAGVCSMVFVFAMLYVLASLIGSAS